MVGREGLEPSTLRVCCLSARQADFRPFKGVLTMLDYRPESFL